MLNRILPVIAVLALWIGAAPAWSAEVGPGGCGALGPAQRQAVDATVRKALADKITPGVSLAIDYRGQKYLRAYGYADLETGSPMTPATSAWVMSINKEFTAASIMLLAERGRLRLDDPLSKFLPDFPRAQDVTLRELLNHTSGLRDLLAQPQERRIPLEWRMMDEPDRGLEELIPAIAAMVPGPYEFEPGTAFKYSNSGYMVLGAVIEKASGMPWKTFFRQTFFEPLHLNATKPDNFYEIVPGRAQGYLRIKGEWLNATPFPHNIAATAGSLRSTAGDILAWQLALAGGRVVNRDSLRVMTTPGLLNDGRPASQGVPPGQEGPNTLTYGAGFMLDLEPGRRNFGHIGNFPGFEATVRTYPDDGLTIVALTNRSEATGALMPQLADDILKGRGAACSAAHG